MTDSSPIDKTKNKAIDEMGMILQGLIELLAWEDDVISVDGGVEIKTDIFRLQHLVNSLSTNNDG